MSWLTTFAVAAGLAGSLTAAMAADMPGEYPPPPPIAPAPGFLDLNYGWYVRGDIGYDWGLIDRAVSAPGFVSPSDSELGNAFTGGVGFGIKSDWLRTDVTVDYHAPLAYNGTFATGDNVTAKVSAFTALFNGYFDLGTWYRMTPYIGAGVGAAAVRTTDYVSAVAPPFSSGLSHTQWNFAWALNAGVGIIVAPNLVLDVGYRYLNLGDTKTASDSFGEMTFKNIAAHEVRAGLRWSFDEIPAEW